MTEHSYRPLSLLGDYFRSAVGLILCIVPMTMIEGNRIVTTIFGCGTAIFLYYGIRTFIRHRTRVEISDHGIAVHGPTRRALSWDSVTKVRLRYFAPRKKKFGGWMQLDMAGDGGRISIESKIDGFKDIAARAEAAARVNGLALDDASAANFNALADPALALAEGANDR